MGKLGRILARWFGRGRPQAGETAPLRRCRHCGAVLREAETRGGVEVCPRCRQRLDEEHYA